VPHAGETTGPQTVWDALDALRAERIGHGPSSVQDERLLARLVDEQVPLEVCPTSNIATRAVARLEEHPIKAMYDGGALVTIGSDDPPMFNTTLNREYEIAAELLGLDERGIGELAKNAVAASFMGSIDKGALAKEIDAYVAARTSDASGQA
jgi:aminodeoxyfutalosine deaminase